MFLSQDIEILTELSFWDQLEKNTVFLKIEYLEKRTFILAETFTIF